MMPKLRTPKYRLHRPSRQAVVTINGRDHSLGRQGSLQSRQQYDELIGRWLAGGRRLPEDEEHERVAISELLIRYYRHAEQCYSHRRTARKRLSQVRCVLAPIRQLYGSSLAASFRPRDLLIIRDRFVELGWSRRTVNESLQVVKRMFRWAVREGLLPGSVWHELSAVQGLRSGESPAREPRKVRPVPDEFVDAIKPHVTSQVWAMIELQRLTGMRPGEACIIRGQDIDMSGDVWIYRPESHKTERYGFERTIDIGPKAQAILRPFLKPDVEAYLFAPADAVTEWREKRSKRRKTRMSCGNRPGSNRKRRPKRKPRDRYDTSSYGQAIQRACDRAFPPPEPLARRKGETVPQWQVRLTLDQKKQLREWQKQHRWHPHQLRHNYGTRIRREFGVEAARILLGHQSTAWRLSRL